MRVSGFYYDKKALKWLEKTLNLNLGHHSAENGGKFTSMGSITVDMAELVDQGDETLELPFPTASMASHFNAKLHITINITPDTVKGMRGTMARAKDMFASARDNATKVAAIGADVMDKVDAAKNLKDDMSDPFGNLGDISDNVKIIAGIEEEVDAEEETKEGAEEGGEGEDQGPPSTMKGMMAFASKAAEASKGDESEKGKAPSKMKGMMAFASKAAASGLDVMDRVNAAKELAENLKDDPLSHLGDISENVKTIAGIEEEGGDEETKEGAAEGDEGE